MIDPFTRIFVAGIFTAVLWFVLFDFLSDWCIRRFKRQWIADLLVWVGMGGFVLVPCWYLVLYLAS